MTTTTTTATIDRSIGQNSRLTDRRVEKKKSSSSRAAPVVRTRRAYVCTYLLYLPTNHFNLIKAGHNLE